MDLVHNVADCVGYYTASTSTVGVAGLKSHWLAVVGGFTGMQSSICLAAAIFKCGQFPFSLLRESFAFRSVSRFLLNAF
jgi:hypothetical protein